MIRQVASLALLTLAAAFAWAQPPTPIRLTLEPGAEPVPALKYLLLPELRDKASGNALLRYYRAFSPEWQGHRHDPKTMEKVNEIALMPLRELRAKDLTSLEFLNSRMLQEVDRGARRTYCDWELIDRFREEGIGLLLPDLQTFREFALLLLLRARQELLANQYDKAARTLQTGLAMSRHVAEGPTLIHGVVGVAAASTMLQAVDDWVDRPGSPNLYWALTELPRPPLVSIRNGLEGERITLDNLFPGYRELLNDPAAPPSSARVLTTMQQYGRLLEIEGPQNWGSALYAMRAYPAAKRFLLAKGRTAAEVDKMPALQAVFLHEIYSYDVAYDDMRKWANLPYHEAAPHLSRAAQRLKAEATKGDRATLSSLLLPAIEKVIPSSARIDRKIAALRCVEALRLHAAANGGKLPTKLDEVTAVPVPADPMTGKPFEYTMEGGKAILSSPAAPAVDPRFATRYELTVRAAKEKN